MIQERFSYSKGWNILAENFNLSANPGIENFSIKYADKTLLSGIYISDRYSDEKLLIVEFGYDRKIEVPQFLMERWNSGIFEGKEIFTFVDLTRLADTGMSKETTADDSISLQKTGHFLFNGGLKDSVWREGKP